MDRYLTTAEVAETLRAPVETVRYWRHVGKGPCSFKLGRRVLYAAEDVETFIAEARESASVGGGRPILTEPPGLIDPRRRTS